MTPACDPTSLRKFIAIGAGIAGAAGLGLLIRRRAESLPPLASRPPPARRKTAHRAPSKPRPAFAPPASETHALRNAGIAGVGIAGGLYAASRLGLAWRGGRWRAMGALTPGMIAFARTPTELLKTRHVPWKIKKTGHGILTGAQRRTEKMSS